MTSRSATMPTIPHMLSSRPVCPWRTARPQLGRRPDRASGLAGRFQPGTVDCLCRATANAPGATFLVIVDPAATVTPSPSSRRRDQHRAGADEYALADCGAVLGRAVVVAGHRAGADIAVAADAGIADIAQVVRLDAGGQPGSLDLDEIAHLDALIKLRAGPQPRRMGRSRSLRRR